MTIVLIQAVHLLHIVSAQLEVKDIKVFGHPGLVNRLRDDYDTTLQQSTQNYLAVSPAVLLTDFGNRFVGEDVVLTFDEWGPGFGLDVLLLVELNSGVFLEPWGNFNLVQGWLNVAHQFQVHQLVRSKVGNPD